jgi:hypothetical protein
VGAVKTVDRQMALGQLSNLAAGHKWYENALSPPESDTNSTLQSDFPKGPSTTRTWGPSVENSHIILYAFQPSAGLRSGPVRRLLLLASRMNYIVIILMIILLWSCRAQARKCCIRG